MKRTLAVFLSILLFMCFTPGKVWAGEESVIENEEQSSEIQGESINEVIETELIEESESSQTLEEEIKPEKAEDTLFSNENPSLLVVDGVQPAMGALERQAHMGLDANVSFYKYEIDYNKYDHNIVEYIVIHDTGNSAVGADAMSHYEFFAGGNRDASAHFFVDDANVVQIIDESEGSWHCGVPNKTPATPISNRNSIGIEMCINEDGDYNAAMNNTIDLAAYLMWKYDLDLDRLVRHYDANGKVCPLTMSDDNWAVWYAFKAKVAEKMLIYDEPYSGTDGAQNTNMESKWFYNPIMGDSVLDTSTLTKYVLERNQIITEAYASQVANAYITISQYYGIRGDLAFFQAMLETGNLNYGGEVDPTYHNFCGMKTPDGNEYVRFETIEQGVEAHIQHLYCYACYDGLPVGRKLIDPKFGSWLRGKSSTWEGLGGIWAQPGYDTSQYGSLEEARTAHDSYGDIIIRLYVLAGGTGVQCEENSLVKDQYWEKPLYTGNVPGQRELVLLGSEGPEVKELQGYLVTIGYSYVSITGSFDEATERAVLDIQEDYHLKVDGIVGEGTWTVVINLYVDTVLGGNTGLIPPAVDKPQTSVNYSLLYYGLEGEEVEYLQGLLVQMGYKIHVNGKFDSATDAAVREFQKIHDLDVDGYVGTQTWNTLESIVQEIMYEDITQTVMTKPGVRRNGVDEVRLYWTDIKGQTGYQISRSEKMDGTSIVASFYSTNASTVTVRSGRTNITQYFKIRAFKEINGEKIYSPWSDIKALQP